MLELSVSDLGPAPLSAVAEIVFVNIVLSGDNAVIIAMACRALPQRQRLWGFAIGAGLAVILLIVFTAVIARLLEYPYLKLIGGLILIYIAVKLLVPDQDPGRPEAAASLWRAIRIVVIADIVMSFDNILAVVEIARDNLTLIAIGLAVSIPLVVAGAALISAALDRLPILMWGGAALLGWVAGETIVSEPAISAWIARVFGEPTAGRMELAAAGAVVVLVIAIGSFCRRRRMSAIRGAMSDQQGEST
jgi:YjbE family integral membrane protein